MKISILVFVFSIVIFLFQNCSGSNFEVIADAQKESFLASSNVFSEITMQRNIASVKETADFKNYKDRIDTVVPVINDVITPTIPVKYYCSNNNYKSQNRFINYKNGAFVKVQNTNGSVVCDEDKDQFKSIINFKKFGVSKECLSKLVKGSKYIVSISEKEKPLVSAFIRNQTLIFDGVSLALESGLGVDLLFADNQPQYTSCDQRMSPLVVVMDGKKINLSAPTEGVYFDILGEKSFPAPHSPKKISWILNENSPYYFIALPDPNGMVSGIDQLFGDNTKGPDGKFSANGYLALAKYDDNKDNYITDADEVFHKLRFWNDTNSNGVSEQRELFTLQQMNVEFIDLNYDSSYQETDIYDNQILMKSVVKTNDGKLHLIFDLWFRILDINL